MPSSEPQRKGSISMPAPPDDVSMIASLYEGMKQFLGPAVGVAGVGAILHAGEKLKELENHGKRIDNHDTDIKTLKASQAAADVKIGALPTNERLDARLDAAVTQIQAQMQAGFAQIIQLVSSHRD